MKIVDTRGQSCPEPLIAAKRALKEADGNEPVEVITDSQTSLNNISKFLKDNNTQFIVKENEDFWTLTVYRNGVESAHRDVTESYTTEIPHLKKGDFVIAFSSDVMGEGDNDLGRLLMTNFIKAIKDFDVLPDKMVFYNRGVKLGAEDSPVLEDLKDLERMGVSLLMCSTCVVFYFHEESVKTGTLSNMFEIAQVMVSAGNVVKP